MMGIKNVNSAALAPIVKDLELKGAAILIAASLFVPFVVHLIPPANGVRLGAVLLPMFYVPLIAVIFYKFRTALVVTAFGPILNYLLTGSPVYESVPLLTFEVLLFVILLTILLKYDKLNNLSALLSILPALIVPPLVFGLFRSSGFSPDHLLISLKNAVPGIIILTVLNIFLLRLRNKH
jgi:hypothetical protein